MAHRARRVSRQYLVAFPASNLVVEPHKVGLSGPSTRRSYRDLTGTGWAVGALLHPAAVPSFTGAPADLQDTYRAVEHGPCSASPAGTSA